MTIQTYSLIVLSGHLVGIVFVVVRIVHWILAVRDFITIGGRCGSGVRRSLLRCCLFIVVLIIGINFVTIHGFLVARWILLGACRNFLSVLFK